MIVTLLLSVVLVSVSADDGPVAVKLIGQLGTGTFDERVAAYKALERLGDRALPALRAAADASDARVQSRVRALIESIGRQAETERFSRPTLVRLDFRDRPLGEIVDALNARHDLGLALRLGPEPPRGMIMIDHDQPKRLKALEERRVTVEAGEPVPFWEAVDRLCKAAALRYDVSSRTGFGASRGAFVLMADRTGRGPISDSGPFRVQVTGARSDVERDFVQDAEGGLKVALTVIPEPGLVLYQNGAVTVTEAVDDRGRSLVPPAVKASDPRIANRSFNRHNHASIQVNAVLAALEPPGAKIRRLRGHVPVIVVTRRFDPLVVPLKGEGVVGKQFSTPDMSLVVDDLLPAPGARFSVRITIRAKRGGALANPRRDPLAPDFAAFNVDRLLDHLELYDAEGRRLNRGLGGNTRGADRQGFYDSYRFDIPSDPKKGLAGAPDASKTSIPTELRYYEFVQTLMDVPFDFHDLPMP